MHQRRVELRSFGPMWKFLQRIHRLCEILCKNMQALQEVDQDLKTRMLLSTSCVPLGRST